MKAGRRLLLLLLIILSFLPVPARADEIRLSVAASMTEAVKELSAGYRANHPEVAIMPNFGGSGALAKQISQGAPADLFISANPEWMDFLIKAGRISPATVRPFARNSLVVIGNPALMINDLTALTTLARIAIGSPRSVPAGQYAAQALRAVGIYAQLAGSGKLVIAQDVRQALLYAERGEVDAALVYKTDALLAQRAVIVYAVPPELHGAIIYPMGLTMTGGAKPAARAFSKYLATPAATAVLKKYGFEQD